LVLLAGVGGCANRERDFAQISKAGLAHSLYVDTVQAQAIPPAGWTRDPLRKSPRHTHEVWRSPTGHTAYGVMHFALPFPVGPDLALWAFLREMQKKQGEAKLISQTDDPALPGIRFIAEGGPYMIRVNLITSGWDGWAVYAGTLRNQPIDEKELDLAERAREYTVTGIGSSRPKKPG